MSTRSAASTSGPRREAPRPRALARSHAPTRDRGAVRADRGLADDVQPPRMHGPGTADAGAGAGRDHVVRHRRPGKDAQRTSLAEQVRAVQVTADAERL